MKKSLIAIALFALSFTSVAVAGNLKIPTENPAASVKVPDSWKPEETDHGYAIESPDQVATVIIEVTTKKKLDSLIDESVDWLVKEQKVKIDEATKKEKDFELADRKWSRISWDAKSKEWGPSIVGFLFTEVGQGKILTVTYWITKKDADKHLETLDKIFASVKSIEE